MTTYNFEVGDLITVRSKDHQGTISSYEKFDVTFPRKVSYISGVTGNLKFEGGGCFWRQDRFVLARPLTKSLEDYM